MNGWDVEGSTQSGERNWAEGGCFASQHLGELTGLETPTLRGNRGIQDLDSIYM